MARHRSFVNLSSFSPIHNLKSDVFSEEELDQMYSRFTGLDKKGLGSLTERELASLPELQ